ncbi:hypothetical protein [Domibacillus sp.]|uniref:hypothetical protein n=1 Tax=Domibacillus sp. TaxID=1969783 RepID=UPI002811E3EA|nr:hypothetical protein [Domibacillus sp.]
MRKKPREIGDKHVKSVQAALKELIHNDPLSVIPETALATAKFIHEKIPAISCVLSKFDSENSSKANDLTLYLQSGEVVTVNLFMIQGNGYIQPRNPGAKSFLSTYFLAEDLQESFNYAFDRSYVSFLQSVADEAVPQQYSIDIRLLKQFIKSHFPKFTPQIEKYREQLLFDLREAAFELLQQSFNQRNKGMIHAFHSFFMTESLNIITRYKGDEVTKIEEFSFSPPRFDDIKIYKKGKGTLGIKFGPIALTLRFKFESGPVSSIKLAASYEHFPERDERERKNAATIRKVEKAIADHLHVPKSNTSNSVGKCHEAISYYYFLKAFPQINQVDEKACLELIERYAVDVKPDLLHKIYKATETIIQPVVQVLNEKHSSYTVEAIELVPEAYVKDKLDTADLQLILYKEGKSITENISLKAAARKSVKITTKNPGIGTILGPAYFNVGSLSDIVNETKEQFHAGQLGHQDSLTTVARELGAQLSKATQEQLKQGIEHLLGEAMVAVTFYEENTSYCKEHEYINSNVEVLVNVPTAIQNTLAWSDGSESISLRVKFSRGQQHGWSSLKLTSEYQLKHS